MIAPVVPGTGDALGADPSGASAPGGRVAAIELSADTLTPVAAALRLKDRLAFILESVEGGARYGRYSFVGVRGRTLICDQGEAVVWDADYQELDRFTEADPLEALRRVLPAHVDPAGFPLPLSAGIGFVSYDAAARWEKLPVPLCSTFTAMMVASGAMPAVPMSLAAAAMMPATCVPCQKVPTSVLNACPGTNEVECARSMFGARSMCEAQTPPSSTATRAPWPR